MEGDSRQTEWDSFGLGKYSNYDRQLQSNNNIERYLYYCVYMRAIARIQIAHRKKLVNMILFKGSLQLSAQRTKVGNTFCLERARLSIAQAAQQCRKEIQREREREWDGKRKRKKWVKGTSETDSCGMFELVNCFALVCNITKNRMQSMRWMREREGVRERERKLQKSQIPH